MLTLSENAIKVLNKRYFKKDENDNVVEDAQGMFRRVAKHIASAEVDEKNRKKWGQKFYELMLDLEFLPNSPVLRNFGSNDGCGSACFVLPIEDDLSNIYDTLRKASLVQKFGGGTGFSFSALRPDGDIILKTGGMSSGPVSFMQVYDFSLGDIIKQGGTRNGANMGVMRVDHPDIHKFITAKSEEGILKNFNLSVGITNAFMEAVEADKSYDLIFAGKVYDTVRAIDVFNLIVKCAYKTGEPGVVFLDTINETNVLKDLGTIEATNPCGEQPLLPYQSCTLGSINLSKMTTGNWTQKPAVLDEIKLKKVAKIGARFLDNVVTKNNYPLPELTEMAKKTRQIGLGVMGFGDLCIKMHIRYGSEESVRLAKKIMGTIYSVAKKTSEALADEKGAFLGLKTIKWEEKPRRNALLTSCAPTGTLATIAGCSHGVEPLFDFSYGKNCIGKTLTMVPGVVEEWFNAHGDKEPLPDFFVSANSVSVDEHLSIQEAFQNNGTDSGVSKTVNMPNEATEEDVSKVYISAWKRKIKGVTVYRYGSRKDEAIVTTQEVNGHVSTNNNGLKRGELKPRPRATSGPTLRMKTACGKLYATPTFDIDGLQEMFIRTEQGGCEANTKALGVLMSYYFRTGGSPIKLKRSLESIKCPACARALERGKEIEVQSCPSGLSTALAIAINNKDKFIKAAAALNDADSFFIKNGKHKALPANKEQALAKCPDCGENSLQPASGCNVCQTIGCGYSKC